MSRGSGQRIAHILKAVDRCQRYVAALDGDGEVVEMAEDAIERNLQIIGEAVSRLPEEVTGAHPEIAWPQIRGFRNILVHQYFGVDVAIVREVVVTYLPPLAAAHALPGATPLAHGLADLDRTSNLDFRRTSLSSFAIATDRLPLQAGS